MTPELREALEPFLATLEHDIGLDEADEDLFRNMSREHARAPRITVGHFRRLAAAVQAQEGEGCSSQDSHQRPSSSLRSEEEEHDA